MGNPNKRELKDPEGTHDDSFWALALSVYAAEMTPPSSKPLAKLI